MIRRIAAVLVVALGFGLAPPPAHAMAPVLMVAGTIWSIYQQVDGGVASAERAAFQVCMEWAATQGAAEERARIMATLHRPMAADPKAMAALASADTAMGQQPGQPVPAACAKIPTGGLLETAFAAINFLDSSPTPTTAAHIAMIRRNIAAKRAALGLAPLPKPRAKVAAPATPSRLAAFDLSGVPTQWRPR